MVETRNMSEISKTHLITNYSKRLKMIIGEKVDRVNLLNALEEPGLCLRCNYCNFLRKLKNKLEENGFFTSNSTFNEWKIEYKKNSILTAEPIHFQEIKKNK